MKRVGAYEAKTHFAQLLDRVQAGERITVTRHGVPAAILVPADGLDRTLVADTIADIRQFRRGNELGDVTIRELVDQGRRS